MDSKQLQAYSVKSTPVKNKESVEVLRDAEMLLYQSPLVESTSVSSRIVENNCDSTSYTDSSSSITCQLASGSDYIRPKDCVFTFVWKCDFTGDGTCGFGESSQGNGSVLNLFRNFRISSRGSSNEIDNRQHNNVLAPALMRSKYNADWWDTWKTLIGSDVIKTTLATGVSRTFVIPMYLFSDLFCVDSLVPAELMSSLSLHWDLESLNNSIMKDGAFSAGSYTISNPKVLTVNHRLTDDTHTSLREQAKDNFLELNFSSYHHQSQNITSTHNEIISRSTMRALGVRSVYRLTANLNDDTKDTFASDNKLNQVQARLGSTFYPNQRLTDPKVIYYATLQSEGKCKGITKLDYTAWSGKQGFYSQSLERSASLQFSGSAISSSQQLAVNNAFSTADAKRADTYVEFVNNLKINLTNVLVYN